MAQRLITGKSLDLQADAITLTSSGNTINGGTNFTTTPTVNGSALSVSVPYTKIAGVGFEGQLVKANVADVYYRKMDAVFADVIVVFNVNGFGTMALAATALSIGPLNMLPASVRPPAPGFQGTFSIQIDPNAGPPVQDLASRIYIDGNGSIILLRYDLIGPSMFNVGDSIQTNNGVFRINYPTV